MATSMTKQDMKRYGWYLLKRLACHLLELASFVVSKLFQPKRNAIPPIDDKILMMPAVELSAKIKNGELKSEEVVKSFINRIKKVNPLIRAVVDMRFNEALEEARALDERLKSARQEKGDKSLLQLPLVGVPMTVKETVALQGSPFTAGVPTRKLRTATKSNQAVDQLRKSGLIPIASTNTPCMNLWWDSANLVYGRTENPYDLSRIPGGSSGGEAAILAAAGSVVGVGSDLAGSIRIPCNFCGIYGHKPTPFTVSNDNVYPVMRKSQEKLRGVGPMCRYACDLLPMLSLMIDPAESPKMNLHEAVDLSKLKLFYLEDIKDPLSSRCDSDIANGIRAAVEYLKTVHGMPVKHVSLEEFKYGMFLWSSEMCVPEGNLFTPQHDDAMIPVDPLLELGKKVTNSSDYPLNTLLTVALEKLGPKHGTGKQAYLAAKATKLRERFYDLVGDNGVLLMPAHPQTAPHHQTTLLKFLNVSYTAVGNTLQAPITQCPLGMSDEGLPYGVQIIAKPYNDRLTLAVARELEKAFGGWLPPSRVTV